MSNTIGIGLIRSAIFMANGLNIDRNFLGKLYRDIVLELDKKGYSWEFFTNGLPADKELKSVINQYLIQEGESCYIKIPKTGGELVSTISRYKGIIAARLHASIIAFSLGIPAIGLVWNQKSVFFGTEIGHSERFIPHENFFAPYIVDRLEQALVEGYSEECTKYIKQSAIESVRMTVSLCQ